MKTEDKVLVIIETSLLTSLALVFDWVANFTQIRLFPNGGSISISMLPVFVIAYRRGLIPGLISGLLLGTLQTILGVAYFLVPLQFLLDYSLAYCLVGVAGVFYKWIQSENKKLQYIGIVSGALLGGFLRFFSHVLAGVVYWARYIDDAVDFSQKITWDDWLFSISYNASYMVPSIIICMVILVMFNKIVRKIYTNK